MIVFQSILESSYEVDHWHKNGENARKARLSPLPTIFHQGVLMSMLCGKNILIWGCPHRVAFSIHHVHPPALEDLVYRSCIRTLLAPPPSRPRQRVRHHAFFYCTRVMKQSPSRATCCHGKLTERTLACARHFECCDTRVSHAMVLRRDV